MDGSSGGLDKRHATNRASKSFSALWCAASGGGDLRDFPCHSDKVWVLEHQNSLNFPCCFGHESLVPLFFGVPGTK